MIHKYYLLPIGHFFLSRALLAQSCAGIFVVGMFDFDDLPEEAPDSHGGAPIIGGNAAWPISQQTRCKRSDF